MHGFLEKNRDDLPSQMRHLIENSSVGFLRELFPPLSEKESGKGGKTIAKKFLSDLRRLKDNLCSTNPHYVRCIKPNDVQARPIDGSICFDAGKTHKQLLCVLCCDVLCCAVRPWLGRGVPARSVCAALVGVGAFDALGVFLAAVEVLFVVWVGV